MATSLDPAAAARRSPDGSSIAATVALIWGYFIIVAIVATQMQPSESARNDTVAGYFEQFE